MPLKRFLLFILCIGQLSIAQQTEHHTVDDTVIERQTITEDDLKPYLDDSDFNYEENVGGDSLYDRFMRWLNNILTKFWEAIFGVGSAGGFLFFVLRILPYILLGILVFLLIRFFLKVNSNRLIAAQKNKATISFSEEEEIIRNEDIPSLIQEAINAKNYRLAIRYYYLLSLKYLTDNERIEWQPQKTNEDYIKELNEGSLQFDFKNITRIYDYVWYGEFKVDAIKFETLKLPFVSLHNSITND
ncbi:DUF4129 domain-containing protein [Winogradskyella immobilis]|uniref:DUF4129 domain-containing protein n=1 Tax=Winogradskyella immobilis TaxID=2816852 RepID=A0ABS8EP38_9FLAO|nr:DUF4129 domain-containing protein [Winogradskyella immobilis]MCC1484981.1 DUF4129 domain-containing protein [Winogradskyella immobilis]MCG0017073.1 DUF4129 domain-containing protein [Winogradskyella immobilis]